MTERTERRGGLGRGLAALIPTGPPETDEPPAPRHGLGSRAADVVIGARNGPSDTTTAPERVEGSPVDGGSPGPAGEVSGAVYREVRLDGIRANPRQPRQVFDEEALAELEHSIREFGLLQPIVVRELAEPETGVEGGPPLTHELVMGERRWRAA